MSKKERNSTTSSNEPTDLTQRESGEISVLSSIEERLIQADNPQDVVLWTEVRKEIIKQDEEAKNQGHRRFMEKAQVWYKMGFSFIAFLTGMILFISGSTSLGLFILGAGLFGVVPDYVKMFFRGSRENDKGEKNVEE